MPLAFLNRTLDQELAAIVRGISLECLVCGEFVLHRGDMIACPECGLLLQAESQLAAAPGERESRSTG
ncbi:MAG: hypothetical protein MSC30_09840 [Gaiellaceae bacterium MAG52_C11]|nr:hypothetical protein [Candidatus Gaiellasilicea maunaloa]